jgi:tetratricopeptide (TPR) repeat protein
LLLRALALDEKALGPQSPDLGTDLSNLGLLYLELRLELRRYAEGETAYQRALSIEIEAYGQEDHTVRETVRDTMNGDTMNGYAMTLRKLHRDEEARKMEDRLRATGAK